MWAAAGDCSHAQFTLNGLAQAAEIAWHQGDNLYDYRAGNEYIPRARLELALEDASLLFLGAGTVVTDAGQILDCEGRMGPGFELPYNHYKYRAQLGVTTFETALLQVRPDDTRSMFVGWSTLTHGNLSQ